MTPETERLLAGLGASALALVPEMLGAIGSGDKVKAAELAEEAARREAFEHVQRRKAERAKKD